MSRISDLFLKAWRKRTFRTQRKSYSEGFNQEAHNPESLNRIKHHDTFSLHPLCSDQWKPTEDPGEDSWRRPASQEGNDTTSASPMRQLLLLAAGQWCHCCPPIEPLTRFKLSQWHPHTHTHTPTVPPSLLVVLLCLFAHNTWVLHLKSTYLPPPLKTHFSSER